MWIELYLDTSHLTSSIQGKRWWRHAVSLLPGTCGQTRPRKSVCSFEWSKTCVKIEHPENPRFRYGFWSVSESWIVPSKKNITSQQVLTNAVTYLSPDSDHSQAASPVKVHFAANTSVRPIQKQVIEFRLNAKNQHLRLDSGWDWVPCAFSADILGHNLFGEKNTPLQMAVSLKKVGKCKPCQLFKERVTLSYSYTVSFLLLWGEQTSADRVQQIIYFNQSLRVESPQLFFDSLSCYLTPRMRPAVHQGSLC